MTERLPMTLQKVKTGLGWLEGERIEGGFRFLGVPYAAPPLGARRFAPPAPVERWEGTRAATRFGPTAPQPALHPSNAVLAPLSGPGWVAGDGGCLTLNVWTPEVGAQGLPVMVYLHGGGFVLGSGSAPAFEGSAFARSGVVLVTINYRLGAEGLLALSGGTTNLALRDQLAALHWVREHISAFGGDAGRVTLFGESAGGTSVALLLRSPLAKGLFRRAIVQSGHDGMVRSLEVSTRVTTMLAARLGVPATVDAFRAIAVPNLLRAQGSLFRRESGLDLRDASGVDPGHGRALFLPTTGDDVLPDPAGVAVDHARGVELLVGTTREEARLGFGAEAFARFDHAQAVAELSATWPHAEPWLVARGLRDPSVGPARALTTAYTDLMFRSPSRRTARRHPGPVFVYEFEWSAPRFGAAHGLDVPFVFDTRAACRELVGDEAPDSLVRAMHRAWVDFASSGTPGWNRYAQDRVVMRFDSTSRVGEDTVPLEEASAHQVAGSA